MKSILRAMTVIPASASRRDSIDAAFGLKLCVAILGLLMVGWAAFDWWVGCMVATMAHLGGPASVVPEFGMLALAGYAAPIMLFGGSVAITLRWLFESSNAEEKRR